MATHIDPVCKMKVDEKLAAEKYEYKGKAYYFCAKGCMLAFQKEPERYLTEDRSKKINNG